MLGLKSAFDKAAKAKGGNPSTADVIKAFENLTFESMDGPVEMMLGKGHQAVSGTAYGTYKFDKETGKPTHRRRGPLPGRLRQPAQGHDQRRVAARRACRAPNAAERRAAR